MIRINENLKIKSFEYFYMFLMVIYMAEMTPSMGRMRGGFTSDLMELFIPIIGHLILLYRNPISFKNRNLYSFIALYLIWAFGVIISSELFTISKITNFIFFIYVILIAYIHVKVFGKCLLPLYEHVIVVLCKIAFVCWFAALLLPALGVLFRKFEATAYGYNILYLFNWMDPLKGQVLFGLSRNAGCSWEPGRFAIMIVLAIFFNLLIHGVTFKNNTNIIWLLITLLSTMSTTGYCITLVIYMLFLYKPDFKHLILFVFIGLPIIFCLFSLDFMGDKIINSLDVESVIDARLESLEWYEKNGGNEYFGSWGRFESIYFEITENIVHNPLLGYGMDYSNSYYHKNISSVMTMAGGLFAIFSKFGIPLGIYLYYILMKSSVCVVSSRNVNQRMGLFIVILLSSISYNTFTFPVFTSFWLYSLFENKNTVIPKFIIRQ